MVTEADLRDQTPRFVFGDGGGFWGFWGFFVVVVVVVRWFLGELFSFFS